MPRPEVNIRQARREDLPAIVELFSQDDEDAYAPGSGGAETSDAGLNDAFEVIASDPNNQVFVAEVADASRPVGLPRAGVVGTFQLTMIRQLNYGGCLVAQVESVFVHPNWRSNGIGTSMMRWAMTEAERRGCIRVQLTSNTARSDAHRFYEALGFRATHKGMKLVF